MFLSFAVSPGTWVPGGLRPGFLLLLLIHDPDIAFLIMHLNVLQVSLAKRASPQFENLVQIFTSTGPGYIDQLACEQKKK